ncbi:L,D-transpeptidase family protein [Pseudaestuariivita sp.]|uniref:L,D-transpeptidase family protein n=1 Tax=Pseudaestuariivita sp. TaxID=2211669 RepID=UPI0040598C4E
MRRFTERVTRRAARFGAICAGMMTSAVVLSGAAQAEGSVFQEVTAFKQAIAEAASRDDALAAFYKSNKFEPIWVGTDADDAARREAFIAAVRAAPMHGLPAQTYGLGTLMSRMRSVQGAEARAALEVDLSRAFVDYAADMQTGALDPQRIDAEFMPREVPLRDRADYLTGIATSAPHAFIASLPPASPEYTRLMKAKIQMQHQLDRGAWGPKVQANSLKPGQTGAAVATLRNRLAAMGYGTRSASAVYDDRLASAVMAFQEAHGLTPDGVAGAGTMAEVNVPFERRMQSVLVAMERERWLNRPEGLGARHILVNIPDFTAKIIDGGKVTFETVAVVGKDTYDRQTPEFSDEMDHMVINPSWYVPRSIATGEYLPKLRANPYAVSHLEITDSRGRVVNRGAVNFAQYSASSFPFNMRQPPGRTNALGLVKYMFPNKHNIYLHDTPAKNLFGREVRAFSHGCIRLAEPFEFGYALLSAQEADPKGYFQSVLRTGAERRVNLEAPVPVHIVYRTAFTTAKGELRFRRDIYGRDARVFRALQNAGVSLGAVQG